MSTSTWNSRTESAVRKSLRRLTDTRTLLFKTGCPLLEQEAVALDERVRALSDLAEFMTTTNHPERS